ncbi:MAG: hypothetical protein K2O31_01380 [Clostridia bacterium]|nr:hypothetical protein [Clostridia bacterium]
MKTFIVLCLYDALLNNEKVSRVNFCAQHNICERTFYRYVNEIGKFFMRYKREYVVAIDTNVAIEDGDSSYHLVKL